MNARRSAEAERPTSRAEIKNIVAEARQPIHNTAWKIEAGRAEIADMLSNLAAQVGNVRRLFEDVSDEAETKTDVVFVDDLTQCMQCSWAKLDAVNVRLTPDLLSQCGRLLDATSQMLQEMQRLQTENSRA